MWLITISTISENFLAIVSAVASGTSLTILIAGAIRPASWLVEPGVRMISGVTKLLSARTWVCLGNILE